MIKTHRTIILAGGEGRRLWPLSHEALPKALLRLPHETHSLLQHTVLRAGRLKGAAAPVVVVNRRHAAETRRQLAVLGVSARLIVEPSGRNTAAALAAAAQMDALWHPDASLPLLVLPADHAIDDEAAWQEAVRQGIRAADDSRLVVFGIAARAPSEAYGYVLPEQADTTAPRRVIRFCEKPDAPAAARLIEQGACWNSGMFVWRREALMGAMTHHQPELMMQVREACHQAQQDEDGCLLPESFAEVAALPVDRAVLEHSDRVVMVEGRFGWADLGEFERLWQHAHRTEDGNALTPNVQVQSARGNYVHTQLPTRLEGVDGLIVVQTEAGLLITRRAS